MVNDRRLSDSNENLSHPLYRSQSLDALQRIGKEPLFKPKRTLSEMKPETRKDSARAKKLQELQSEALNEGANGQSPDNKPRQERVVDFTTPNGQMNTTLSDVTVHTEAEGQKRSGLDFPDIGIPNFGKGVHCSSVLLRNPSVTMALMVKLFKMFMPCSNNKLSPY